MKKFICSVLIISLISTLFLIMPTSAFAAETITDEALFMTYPTYLSNSEMDEGLAKAEAAYYAVISSYSETDEIVAKAVTILSEGVDIAFKESLSVWGITDNYYESCVKKAAKQYMQSMLENENVLKKATKKVQDAYKGIKTVYSTATTVAKEELIIELTKVAAENDIGISTKAMDAYVKSAYESGTLKNDLDAIGAVNDLWKYVIEFSELHAIEVTTLDLLMEELIIAGQGDSDLCIGLGLLKDDIAKDEYYILENYATKTVINILSDVVDELIGNVTGTVHLALIKCCIKVFSDYVYVNAKADEITQAIMQTSFVSSVDICLSQYRLKFLQGTGTAADIETYESLYAAGLSAREAVLNTCYDIAKITDKFSLGGDCLVWADNIKYTYTYDNYIKWCKEAVAHDIANAELDSSTGTSTITDALNEETIKARLDKIRAISFYMPNVGETFNGEFDGARGTIGFAAKVFSYIFDKHMGTRVESRYNHILTNNKNVRVIGRLEEDAVTESALKDLFSNVRIGDIVLTSGQYDYLHAMVVVSVGEDGVLVYDCDSEYNPDAPEDMRPYTIQQYTISYKKMADAFSKNGEYLSIPGITVYRAVNKVNSTNSGSNLHYAEYDDSVNYAIQDGILYGYSGTRTTLVVPEEVTKISSGCFEDNTNIEYVYMPDTVTEIGESAFEGCSALRFVDLSSALNNIGYGAFEDCTAMTTIRIPEGVIKIDDWAFSGCTSLKNVNIPYGVASIGRSAFNNCSNLIKINIPDSVINIGIDAFYKTAYYLDENNWSNDFLYIDNHLIKCRRYMETPPVRDGIISIAGRAFNGNSKMKNITIPVSVKGIGSEAFRSCTSLESIIVFNGITNMGSSVFHGTAYYANERNWDNGVLYVGNNLIDIKDSVTSVDIKEDTACIAESAFRSKNALESVTINDKVKRIDDNMFSDCNSLKNVSIGSGVTSIGDSAFGGCEALKSITIPDGVTHIGKAAFLCCLSLEKITIPDSVTQIGDSAFYNCKKLESINIPYGVTSIGESVFQYCSELKSINIPYGITNIGDSAFEYCEALKNITIPDSVTSIGKSAFHFCDSLKIVNVGKGVKYIGDSAFSWCHALKSVIIPDGVESIGNNVFEVCWLLEFVRIPRSVTSIGDFGYQGFFEGVFFVFENSYAHQYAISNSLPYMLINDNNIIASGTCGENATWIFDSYGTLTISGSGDIYDYNHSYDSYDYTPWHSIAKYIMSIKIENGITNIGNYAFSGCSNLAEITIPNGVSSIGAYAFNGCYDLTQIIIPDSVLSIGESAFYSCNLNEIVFPDSLISIGEGAFSNGSLTEIVIPESVSSIGEHAFANCSRLTSITVSDGNDSYASVDGVLFNKNKTKLIQYPDYKADAKYTIPDSVTDIGNYAFGGCDNLVEIVIPGSVINIGDSAFSGCYVLEKVTISDGVATIGENAFNNCRGLTEIVIPNSVTSIGGSAFNWCDALESITISDNIEYIGSCVFDNTAYYNNENNWDNGGLYVGKNLVAIDDSVTSVNVREDTECIAQRVFGNKLSLESVTIDAKIKHIEDTMFSWNTALKVVDIGDSVTSIGERAFFNCEALEKIIIPDSVTSIGDAAFSRCEALSDITIPDSVTSIGRSAFFYCKQLESINIPDGITGISNAMFCECSSLKSVNIGEGVTSIGNSAFSRCEALEKITIPTGVTTIEEFAFNGCSGLTDVYYTGTEEDWNKITIGSGNEYLTNATIHFEAELPEEEEPDAYLPGDINGDGEVTTKDVTVLRRYIAGGYNVTVVDEALDVNRDDAITTKDVTTLRRFIAGGYGIELN